MPSAGYFSEFDDDFCYAYIWVITPLDLRDISQKLSVSIDNLKQYLLDAFHNARQHAPR